MRRTIDGPGARKNEIETSSTVHRMEECDRSGEVVSVIFVRISDGFGDGAEGGEVQDRNDAGMCLERVGQFGRIQDVTHHQWSPAYELGVTAGEIVVADRLISCFAESLATMRPDIPGPARNQNASPPSGIHFDSSPTSGAHPRKAATGGA